VPLARDQAPESGAAPQRSCLGSGGQLPGMNSVVMQRSAFLPSHSTIENNAYFPLPLVIIAHWPELLLALKYLPESGVVHHSQAVMHLVHHLRCGNHSRRRGSWEGASHGFKRGQHGEHWPGSLCPSHACMPACRPTPSSPVPSIPPPSLPPLQTLAPYPVPSGCIPAPVAAPSRCPRPPALPPPCSAAGLWGTVG